LEGEELLKQFVRFLFGQEKGSDVICILLGRFVPPNCGRVTFISPTGSVQLKWQKLDLWGSIYKLTKIVVE
jgi:hypothetical protein